MNGNLINMTRKLASVAAMLALALAPVATSFAETTYGGSASTSGDQLTLTSNTGDIDTENDFGVAQFDVPSGTTFADLTHLSTDYNVTDDGCMAGSPRFQIEVNTGSEVKNIFSYLGPEPDYDDCPLDTWVDSGDLLDSSRSIDTSQVGGTFYDDYDNAVTNYGSYEVQSVSLVVDSGWAASDQEQTVIFDDVMINDTTHDFTTPPEEEETAQVTITKYVDEERATSESADGLSFPMSSSWNAENLGGPGTGTYTLSPESYEAVTSEMTSGTTTTYTTQEDLSGENVGASCEDGKPFALTGYTSGDSMSEAEEAEPSMTPPVLEGITNDKYIIVWNEDCTPPEEPPEDVQVFIIKYVDDSPATATSTGGASFPMSATWNDPEGIGAGTGSYTLGSTTDPAYEAQTIEFNPGADYSTNEVVGGDTVGASCETGDQPYALEGYTTGSDRDEAEEEEPSMDIPTFTDMQEDKYVIVWNVSCDGDGGDEEAELEVRSIEALDTTGTADGDYDNGWSYLFRLTLPNDENGVAMRFSDWESGDDTMPVAGNMRISSEQASNDNQPITVVAENTYTTPDLDMVEDLDPDMAGMQVEVLVEVRIPEGTESGSYSTTYGVRSQ